MIAETISIFSLAVSGYALWLTNMKRGCIDFFLHEEIALWYSDFGNSDKFSIDIPLTAVNSGANASVITKVDLKISHQKENRTIELKWKDFCEYYTLASKEVLSVKDGKTNIIESGKSQGAYKPVSHTHPIAINGSSSIYKRIHFMSQGMENITKGPYTLTVICDYISSNKKKEITKNFNFEIYEENIQKLQSFRDEKSQKYLNVPISNC